MDRQPKTIDPNSDGRLERDVRTMTPKENLDYLWQMIEMKNFVKKHVKRM